MRILVTISFLAIVGAPAHALDYTCPSDPGFCYLDVANDGCFDSGTDSGPVDAQLEAGTFAPGPGSIVCPPSVAKLTVDAPIQWETSGGGDVILHLAKVIGGAGVAIDSEGQIYLGGLVKMGPGDVTLQSTGDLSIVRGVLSKLGPTGFADCIVTSADGDVVFGAKARLRCKDGTLSTTNGGDIILEEKATLEFRPETTPAEAGRILASGDLITTDANLLVPSGRIELEGIDVQLSGRTKIETLRDVAITSAPGGEVRIESVVATMAGVFSITAGDVAIGIPDVEGRIRRSKLKVAQNQGASADVSASGSIEIRETTIQNFVDVDLETTGTEISFVESRVQYYPTFPAGTTRLTAGAGSTCDVTDTAFVNSTLTTACDSVIGP